MTSAHLFDGIGGFHLASDRAGMETVWVSEIDRHASAVLKHHWPTVPNLGDIHGITDAPGVDVLTGGFPCQDYSVAGRGAGLAGDRGALWWQFHRLIAELNPEWVVAENVDGLTNRAHRASLRTIIGSLVSLGYGVVWRVFDARYFGVAQRRNRVFIVGHSGGQPRPEILALAQGVSGDSRPSGETGSITSALTHNGLGGGGPDDNLAQAGHLVAFDWMAGGDRTSSGAFSEDGSTPTVGTRGRVAFAQNQRDELRELDQAGTLSAERWGTAKNETLLATSIAVRGRADGQEWELGEPGVANALRAGDGGSSRGNWMTDFAQVRRLTPLECERLQGFPDDWTDIPGNSDTQRYRQLGNAVAVPVAEWIMRRLAA